MEFRQLKYFLMLADELHFNRAAEKLFIVQPALSKQIKDLEEELGVVLFDRNKRNVKLTQAGEYLKNEVKDLVLRLEETKNRVKWVGDGAKGEIRIGYVGSCIHTFLPNMLFELTEKFPNIQTYLNEMTSSAQLAAIQKGDLDIAFLRNPPMIKDLVRKLIFSETFSLVLPINHRINQNNFESISQFANENFILPTRADGEIYHQVQWSICENAGFLPKIAHETVHGHSALKLVELNLGISFLPTSFKKVTNTAVKFIELAEIIQRAEITALWDSTNPNPSLKKFLDICV